MGGYIKTRIKEHHWHIRLHQLDKSVMAKHSINLGHYIQFQDIRIPAARSIHIECIMREATEIKLQLKNIHRK
jgi:hypothetical protein